MGMGTNKLTSLRPLNMGIIYYRECGVQEVNIIVSRDFIFCHRNAWVNLYVIDCDS